jgi:flagellar basal-body rod protein FlgB
MLSRLDNDLNFVQTALKLRSQRQEVLAANLANADTPNFKARDLDFASALKGALAGSGIELARTSPRHLEGAAGLGTAGTGALKYRQTLQPSLDGNTVDADVERAHFSDNALHLQFLLDRAGSTFRTARMALESN